MEETSRDHCCSVTLIILGDDLDCDDITQQLGIEADRTWCKGERKAFQRRDGSWLTFDSLNQESGFKCFIPGDLRDEDCSTQLGHWLKFVNEKRRPLKALSDDDARIILDIYVNSLEAVRVCPKDLILLGKAGVELNWNLFPKD